ncbi:MAG: DUF115 domain-containing protein [Candidatus Gastranaerophilales bacterium]|nr:DUF115 domain-containing protein [Candidatus Gastranaerophilales bacterium]
MFQKNITALKSNNPDLAAKLENISIDKIKNIEVFESESKDLLISYRNVMLHSAIDPVREAKAVWNRTITRDPVKNDIMIVFGLGMGYLFKRSFISSNSKIFLFEPFIDVLRFILEYVDFSSEFSQDRVYITDNIQDIISKIESVYLSGDKVEFLFLNSYVSLAKNSLSELVEKTLNVCSSKIADQNTIFTSCAYWTKNTILNMSNYADTRPAGFYENSFSKKPCLLISAGPSLKNNLNKIKEYKDKFVIIAVASAYRFLLEAGIVPDFLAYTEPINFTNQVKGTEKTLENINIIMGTRADSDIFDYKTASKLLYFTDIDPLALQLQSCISDNVGMYKSGGTVSIISYYFAKVLGCDPVICAGLDLAFIDNKIYADGRELELTADGKINPICPGTENVTFNKNLTYVKDCKGQMVKTRDDYALFIRQFEDILANEVNPRVINISNAGAFINGMEYMEFDQVVQTLNQEDININQILTDISQKTGTSWMKASNTALNELSVLQEKVLRINSKSKILTADLNDVFSFIEDQERTTEVLARLEVIKNELISLRNEVINDPYISNYMQPYIWTYSQSYKITSIPKMEDIIFNMKLEFDFFKQVNVATNDILLWIDQSLKKNKSELTIIRS